MTVSITISLCSFPPPEGNCPMIHIPGFTYPVQEYLLEDVVEKLRWGLTASHSQACGRAHQACGLRMFSKASTDTSNPYCLDTASEMKAPRKADCHVGGWKRGSRHPCTKLFVKKAWQVVYFTPENHIFCCLYLVSTKKCSLLQHNGLYYTKWSLHACFEILQRDVTLLCVKTRLVIFQILHTSFPNKGDVMDKDALEYACEASVSYICWIADFLPMLLIILLTCTLCKPFFILECGVSLLFRVCVCVPLQIPASEAGASSQVEARLHAWAGVTPRKGAEGGWVPGELALLRTHPQGQVSHDTPWLTLPPTSTQHPTPNTQQIAHSRVQSLWAVW